MCRMPPSIDRGGSNGYNQKNRNEDNEVMREKLNDAENSYSYYCPYSGKEYYTQKVGTERTARIPTVNFGRDHPRDEADNCTNSCCYFHCTRLRYFKRSC